MGRLRRRGKNRRFLKWCLCEGRLWARIGPRQVVVIYLEQTGITKPLSWEGTRGDTAGWALG
jgi:hypothetical protein